MFETRIISISRVSVYVMSLPCLAWLSSVSICLGGISTQLHSGNSHDDNSRLLLQITPVPMESRKLLSMKEWKKSRDLARVEPVQHISLADLTRTKPEPMQISIFSAVPLFGADRSYISLQQMNSGGRTPMIWSHTAAPFCSGPASFSQCYVPGSTYFCIEDPAPQHEWQGHGSGMFQQLMEWMEWSLLIFAARR